MARRHRLIILETIVFVPLIAVLVSLHQPRLYSASAEVLLSTQNLATQLNGIPDPNIYQSPDRTAQTQALLARVPEVAMRTVQAAGVRLSSDSFLANSSVTPKTNANLLDFTVQDHSRMLATRLAGTYAEQFVRYRQRLDTRALHTARTEVQQRIAKLSSAGDKSSPVYQSLITKDEQLATMEALQGSNASVVRTPSNAAQVQPKPVRNGILGLALGVALGIGLAFLREALDTRLRSADDIAERLGMPLLARLPAPPRGLRKKDRLVMLAEPAKASSEAFRMLRTNLDFVRLDNAAKSIMVTSSVEREGKSTTVANLAIALARGGERVALLDLDLRRPFLSRFFDLDRQPGVTEVAIGRAHLEGALVQVNLGEAGERGGLTRPAAGNGRAAPTSSGGSLHVLAAGVIPPNPGEFVGSDALATILDELQPRFDTILIDAPPALQVGDAIALSRHVDGIIVVVRLNVARRPLLNELHRQLSSSPAAKLGFVLTAAESEEGYGYGRGYYYETPQTQEEVSVP
ncbi:MAG: hypothetical protein H0W90_09775 [Actinobacteria bacterium]|nr:hypothetical protein [Actinomycetota bacterium]